MTLEEELNRRVSRDGIPRYITEDGRIMKCDWILPDDAAVEVLSGEELEAHIAKLIKEQT